MREENYTYDHLGRVTQVQKKIYNVTYTTSCAYNLAGEVTTMTYPLPTLLDLVKDIMRAAPGGHVRRYSFAFVTVALAFVTTVWHASSMRAQITVLPAPQEIPGTESVEFLQHFRRLPPQERVEVWRRSTVLNKKNALANRLSGEIYSLMVSEGLDTIPHLVRIVRDRKEPLTFRIRALEMLAHMDKCIPYVEGPLAPAGFYVPELKAGCTYNTFLAVDGKRIGREGLNVLMSAAEQAEEELRFHARSLTGLLERDLRALGIEEQIKGWRDAGVKWRSVKVHREDAHAVVTSNVLRRLLIERVPESIPLLVKLLESEKNPYVREAAILLFESIDAQRFRLRGSLVGRDAIGAIHRAIAAGNLKPYYDTEQKRKELWQQLYSQFYLDEFRMDPTSDWAFFANAMEMLFGDKTTNGLINRFVGLKKASAEFQGFLTFLTNVDPFFPSWEYIFDEPVPPRAQVLHPLFRSKVERYHQEWLRFQASKQGRLAP